MNYKKTNTAIKWIKMFEKEELIKKVEESSYKKGGYKLPAKYILK